MSDYSSALVLAKQSDRTYRTSIDYRNINAQTMKDAYAVASMNAIVDKLMGAKYISKTGLKNTYLQVPM